MSDLIYFVQFVLLGDLSYVLCALGRLKDVHAVNSGVVSAETSLMSP